MDTRKNEPVLSRKVHEGGARGVTQSCYTKGLLSTCGADGVFFCIFLKSAVYQKLLWHWNLSVTLMFYPHVNLFPYLILALGLRDLDEPFRGLERLQTFFSWVNFSQFLFFGNSTITGKVSRWYPNVMWRYSQMVSGVLEAISRNNRANFQRYHNEFPGVPTVFFQVLQRVPSSPSW